MKRIFIAVLAALVLAGCGNTATAQEYVSGALGVDCSAAVVAESADEHGGFHGDGETKIILEFPDGLSVPGDWTELPAEESLAALMDYADGFFPEAENGWLWFLDRHRESVDTGDWTAVQTRHSLNFTLALYDADTGRLYYYEIDT